VSLHKKSAQKKVQSGTYFADENKKKKGEAAYNPKARNVLNFSCKGIQWVKKN